MAAHCVVRLEYRHLIDAADREGVCMTPGSLDVVIIAVCILAGQVVLLLS